MDRGIQAPAQRKLRWSLASLMGATAAIALVLALVRPFTTSAAIRAARAVLDRYGLTVDPAFEPADFAAEPPVKTLAGFWQVRFVRVRGTGPGEHRVMVPEGAISAASWNPWWRPSE